MSRNSRSRASRRSLAQQSQHAALGLADDAPAVSVALSPLPDVQPSSYSTLPVESPVASSSTLSYTSDPELQYQQAAAAVVRRPRSRLDWSATTEASASAALLLEDEGAHLLSPSTTERAETRLNALTVPVSRYSDKRAPVQSFYDSQNEFVDSLKRLLLLQNAADSDEAPSTAAYLAIQISLALTFVLLGLKLFTAVYSNSIAVIASAVDSILDVLSQGTLLLTSRLMKRYDPYNYPAGKNRMEPTAVLVFSIIMGMAALFLLYVSVNDLISGLQDDGKRVKMDAVTVTILAFVVGVQLVMWMYCRRVAALGIPGASAAAALAQDHINDVFINIIGGVPAVIAGFQESAWIADPIGGICLSLYIAVRWTFTGIAQLPAMTGRTAPPSFLNQLTYLAGTHDPRILKIDTCLAYHVGNKFQCELHIVLPEDLSLRTAHDIGESLEQKIERLDAVEMAFVHLDYEFEHKPEHAARARAAGKDGRKPHEAAEAAAAGNAPTAAASAAAAAEMAVATPAMVLSASIPTAAPFTAERAVQDSVAVRQEV